MNDRPGASFEESEVVDLYPFRPPYPEAVFEKLRELATRHDAMLDIGCGPGKVSRPLAQSFAQVVAVDPSQHMIALGQSLPDGRAPNLHWVRGLAEEAPLDGWRFDLTVAAASIHWMDHDRLFPHLLAHAAPGHVFAAVSGDDAFEPPWQADWQRFLAKWVMEVTGRPFRTPPAGCDCRRFPRPRRCGRTRVLHRPLQPERRRFHQVPALARHLGLLEAGRSHRRVRCRTR